MAKQRGLHQIKGKVGEYSYYSQTGVSGGLIRKINEGLSARVKNDAAYANTRLNNREFGAAADTASLLGKCVVPKFRPMILPFSQSKMAKEVLKVARVHTENWGERVVESSDTERLCEILTAQSKLNFTDMFTPSVERDNATEATIGVSFTPSQAEMMLSLGITEINIRAVQYDVATGQWVPLAQSMSTGYVREKDSALVADDITIHAGQGYVNSETFTVATFVPEANHAGHQIVVFVAMPTREVGSNKHILQEYCSFIALPLPANA